MFDKMQDKGLQRKMTIEEATEREKGFLRRGGRTNIGLGFYDFG